MSGLVIERPAASQDAPLGERSTGFVKTAVRLVRNLHMIAREFDNPLRSILIGLTANSIDVDVERLRLLKPLDQRFRNQCLALLMGTPGFDVHKAVELMPHEEPLRTQALALLVAAGSVDAERLVVFAHAGGQRYRAAPHQLRIVYSRRSRSSSALVSSERTVASW